MHLFRYLINLVTLGSLFLAFQISVAEPTSPADLGRSDVDELEAEEGDEMIYNMSDFVVTAEDDQGYYSANSGSATRSNSLVKNTPITMSIVNEELIADLGLDSTEDLAAVVAGIDSDPDGYSLDQIRIRGFRTGNSRFDYFPRTLPRNNYNINRVDVIKGANSLIFGQASPGGTVNTISQVANFNKDLEVVSFGFGDKEYKRGQFVINRILSDALAVKVIGVNHTQRYDHPYKRNKFLGATVAVTYQPTTDTKLNLHIEGVDTDTYFPARSMKDATKLDDDTLLDSDIRNDGYNGVLSREDYEVPFTSDYVKYLPQAVVDHIVSSSTRFSDRSDIYNLYEGIDADNYGAVTGPDKVNDRDGYFAIANLQHRLNDKFQLEFAVNRQEVEGNGLNRDSYGAGKVRNFFSLPYDGKDPKTQYNAGEPHIRTYWTKSRWDTVRDGVKATFLLDQDFRNTSHKLIGGVDYDANTKDAKEYDMIPDGALKADGSYAGQDHLNNARFTDKHRSYEYFGIDTGFDESVPGITFDYNTDSNIDLLPLDGTGTPSNDFTLDSYGNDPDSGWALRRTQKSEVKTFSQWFALQSEFFEGRFLTLLGARYDAIQLRSSLRKVVIHGYEGDTDDGFNNRTSDEYAKVSPSIGGLFWVTPSIGLFGNYAESIESPVGTERTPLGDIAPPEYGTGLEGGVRFSLNEGKLDGQMVFYSIEKENDNEFAYTLGMLKEIYPQSIYGTEFPEIYYNSGGLRSGMLPGRRAEGDVTLSRGIEIDASYNPNKNWTFFGSYNHTLKNSVKSLHPSISPDEQRTFFYEGDELLGRPKHRLNLTMRYKFTDGALKNFALGGNQSWRSRSMQTFFILPDGSHHPLRLGHEFTTNLFFTYSKRLKGGRNAPELKLGLNINNVLDNRDLVNRGNYAFYKEGRSMRLTAKLLF